MEHAPYGGGDGLESEALDAGKQIWRAALLADREIALQGCIAARRVLQASPEYALLIRIPWREAADGDPAAIRMRAPCGACSHRGGIVRLVSGQHVVRCAGCTRYQYCAPRSEVAAW
jgi:hypothetical protein